MKRLINAVLILLITLLGACASINSTPPTMRGDLLWQSHEQRPLWAITPPPHDSQFYYFVGFSDLLTSERASRDSALLAAAASASQFFIATVTSDHQRSAEGSHTDSITGDLSILENHSIRLISESILTRMTHAKTYVEQWEMENTGLSFKTIVLLKLPRQDGDKAYSIAKKIQSGGL